MKLFRDLFLIISLVAVCACAGRIPNKSRQKRFYADGASNEKIPTNKEVEADHFNKPLKSSVKIEQPEQGFGQVLAGFFYEVESFFSSIITVPKKPKLPEIDIEFIDHYNADPSYY